MSTTSTVAKAASPQPAEAESLGQKILAFFLKRRVRLTAILFVVLLAEDMWERVVPRNLENLSDFKVLLGLALVLTGLAVRSWAAGTLHKRTQLTTSGPYGLVRHPLYIGSFMMMLGFCTLIDDPENIWFVLGPVLFLYILRALHEEKILGADFVDQWRDYTRRVPRFFPRRIPTQPFASWSFDQWLKNREYQAVGAVFLGLLALQVWQSIV
jgi:protein-S-isoprenylcysteine O-methyltransferase Ste14